MKKISWRMFSYFELEKFVCFCFVCLVFFYQSVPVFWQLWRYISTSWSVLLLTSVTLKILMSFLFYNLFDFSDWMLVSSIDFGHRTGDNCLFCSLNVLILFRLCTTRKLAPKQTWRHMWVPHTGWRRRSYGGKDTDEK